MHLAVSVLISITHEVSRSLVSEIDNLKLALDFKGGLSVFSAPSIRQMPLVLTMALMM